jgi:hypothetical protein
MLAAICRMKDINHNDENNTCTGMSSRFFFLYMLAVIPRRCWRGDEVEPIQSRQCTMRL